MTICHFGESKTDQNEWIGLKEILTKFKQSCHQKNFANEKSLLPIVNSIVCVTNLNQLRNLPWEIFHPYVHKIPDCMASF